MFIHATMTACVLVVLALTSPRAIPAQNASQPVIVREGHQPEDPQMALADARVLVFTRTEGFRHGSIEAGVRMFKRVGEELRFEVVQSEDPALFTSDGLSGFDAVVFLSTTGDVLDDDQQVAFEAYIRAGGGYLGIHAASDTEYDWEFYGELVGAYFAGHPSVQEATVQVKDTDHPATRHLPSTWIRTDEWYNFRAPPKGVHVLMALDTASYEGSTMGDSHPIAWSREMGKGRSLYTGGGHTDESFQEPEFREHLIGSLLWITRRDGADEQPVPSDPS